MWAKFAPRRTLRDRACVCTVRANARAARSKHHVFRVAEVVQGATGQDVLLEIRHVTDRRRIDSFDDQAAVGVTKSERDFIAVDAMFGDKWARRRDLFAIHFGPSPESETSGDREFVCRVAMRCQKKTKRLTTATATNTTRITTG